jgi:hypothetical protein
VQRLKRAAPTIKVLTWLGLPLKDANNGYVDLTDELIRQKVVELSAYLTKQVGFDGIHLDPEPILNNDRNILLTEVRAGIP